MSPANLLIVDDEERFLTTTGRLLEKHGMSVFTCTNGFDALDVVKENRIDVVLLDVKMPGIDGIEVLQEIKRGFPEVEVILFTGHASVESAVEGLKKGAFDYLTKPSTVEDIEAKVGEAMRKKRGCEERTRKARLDRIISHPMAVFDQEIE